MLEKYGCIITKPYGIENKKKDFLILEREISWK